MEQRMTLSHQTSTEDRNNFFDEMQNTNISLQFDAVLCVFKVFPMSYLTGLGEVHAHCISLFPLQPSLWLSTTALLRGNLKLSLIGAPVTVFKWSFRQVNGISAERSTLDVQSGPDNRNELRVKCD